MKNLLLILSVLIFISSCATIMTGKTQEITFDSEPQGAEVTVNGRVIGKTPTTIQLDKKKDQSVSFKLEGYKTQTRRLETKIQGFFWGNIVSGGFIGSTTDGITGGMHEYSPNQYYITLSKDKNVSSTIYGSEKAEVKEFIVLSYRSLMVDLSRGKGDYLDSLLSMLDVKESNKNDSIRKIKSLSEIYDVIPEFAEQIANLFLK
jgi:uncharacterized protein YceK